MRYRSVVDRWGKNPEAHEFKSHYRNKKKQHRLWKLKQHFNYELNQKMKS